MPRPAVFLDRDDTLIANRDLGPVLEHFGDLYDPALVRLLPGVARGLARLHAAGFGLVCVTNQGAVARGRCTIEQVVATNLRLRELVRAEAGVELNAVYFCPFHPKGVTAPWNTEHSWRKPAPGMLLQAAADLGLDLIRSWMIGDSERDIEAALAAGLPLSQTILVGGDPTSRACAGHRVPDFAAATNTVLTHAGQQA